jgi:hypothetical protein
MICTQQSYYGIAANDDERTYPSNKVILLQGLPHCLSHILARMLSRKLSEVNEKFL